MPALAGFVQLALDFSSAGPLLPAGDKRPEAGFGPAEEVLPALAGRTWLLRYEDEARRIALPFSFEELRGAALAAGEAVLRLQGFGALYAAWDGRVLRFARRGLMTEGKGRKRVRFLGPLEQASWHLEAFPWQRPKAPKPRLQDAAVPADRVGDELCALVGCAVSAGFYSCDPVLWEVRSLPFVLEEVRQEGDRLSLSGTGGAAAELSALKGVRVQCYSGKTSVIIDAATESMGYCASFHLTF